METTFEDCVEELMEADEEISKLLKEVLETEPDPLVGRGIKRKLIRRFSPKFQPSDLPRRERKEISPEISPDPDQKEENPSFSFSF